MIYKNKKKQDFKHIPNKYKILFLKTIVYKNYTYIFYYITSIKARRIKVISK